MTDLAAITSGLRLDADGIWRATSTTDVSYPSDGHAACLQVEESSFWFNHRNACIAALATAFPPLSGGPIFDVGGGNGYVSLGLETAGFDVVLVEPGPEGASNAKQRGVSDVICATTDSAGFAPGSINAAGMFDVIEHIEDDHSFLAGIGELMPTGGRVYATVPAYQALWSNEDVVAGHHRRYSRDEITSVLRTAGFDVDYATYIFRPLPLPVAIMRALPFRLRRGKAAPQRPDNAKDHATGGGPLASIIDRVLAPEVAKIAAKEEMAFGGSILLTATKA